MASTPQFAATAKSWQAWTVPTAGGTTAPSTFTTSGLQAASARSGSTSTAATGAVSLLSAGTSGTRVDEVTFTSLGTSTANIGRIFIYNGTNYYLYKEIVIPAVTPTASVATASVTTTFSNFIIPSGSSIYVSVATLDAGYSVVAFGGDF